MAEGIDNFQVWIEASKLRRQIELLARRLPSEEKFRLTDQIIRCARSVTANIAEAYGRFGYKDSKRIYIISRGSMFELKDHLNVAVENEYISFTEFTELNESIQILIRKLNAYLKYLADKSTN